MARQLFTRYISDYQGSDVYAAREFEKLTRVLSRLDSLVGLPPGGAEDDVLVKASSSDYDAEWRAGGGGGGYMYFPGGWT
jgi:hypothetical protein